MLLLFRECKGKRLGTGQNCNDTQKYEDEEKRTSSRTPLIIFSFFFTLL